MRRDGTSLIFIQYCESAENKTLLNTEIAIPPNYWNRKLKRISDNLPIGHGKTDELNKDLQRQVRLAEDIISYALVRKIHDPVEFAKSTFTPGLISAVLKRLQKKINPESSLEFKLSGL